MNENGHPKLIKFGTISVNEYNQLHFKDFNIDCNCPKFDSTQCMFIAVIEYIYEELKKVQNGVMPNNFEIMGSWEEVK